MENPEISGRIQVERFIPVEIDRKKVILFEVSPFSPFLPKRPKFSVPFVWITSARLHVERKWNFFSVFCKWYNSIPFLFFRCPKKYQYHLTEIFHRNFRTNGMRSRSPSASLPSITVKWPIAIEIHPSGKLCVRDRKYSCTDGGKYFLCAVNPRPSPPPCWRQRGRDGLSIRWPHVSRVPTTRRICSR